MPAVEKPKYILSFDDVRGILGIGPKELKDATIALQAYAIPVEGAIERIHEGLPEKYDEIKAKSTAEPAVTLTRTEKKLLGLTETYATYFEAKLILTNMKSGALKKITDGKAEAERFPIDFDLLTAEIDGVLADLLARLEVVMPDLGLQVEALRFTYLTAIATLGVDPVTGE